MCAPVAEHPMQAFKDWVRNLRADVEVTKEVLESTEADREARKLSAAALSYVVTRMDLVPDWEEPIGVLDDAMVLRVAISLAARYDMDRGLPAATVAALGRLANQVDPIEEFLGEDLFVRFRRHCEKLAEVEVRGRTPSQIVDDQVARDHLYREIADELERANVGSFADSEALAVKFKSYLGHKLKE